LKIRQGFVSNSSSSSFVVLLNEMTSEQQEEFKKRIDEIDWEEVCYDYGEPRYALNGKVFGGECDYDAASKTSQILNDMGLTNLMGYFD